MSDRGKSHPLDQPNRSYRDWVISQSPQCIHVIRAADEKNVWCCHVVYVLPSRARAFDKAMWGQGIIDLREFGEILCANLGLSVSKENRKMLKIRFGFEPN